MMRQFGLCNVSRNTVHEYNAKDDEQGGYCDAVKSMTTQTSEIEFTARPLVLDWEANCPTSCRTSEAVNGHSLVRPPQRNHELDGGGGGLVA